ncbi:MAG: FAD-dependent oxidoreductase, partial [ANME-2 cluster archaeon]|nr:FAD-dependent oxidoreductase [ANME-2 cluster archaeon]
PVSFILMVLGMLADGQLGLLEGGCFDFVQPIEKRYRDLGGKITYKAKVEEIIVENNQAVGVRLVDGSEHFADIVVSAADGYNTIFKFLGGRYVNEKIKNRYNNWKLTRPLVMVSFGVAREFTNEPWMSSIKLKRPITVGKQSVNTIAIRIFNYSNQFAPPGKTVVQVLFETEWDFWKELQSDRPQYEIEKETIAAEVLNRLEAHYSGISSLVEVTDVATPCTWWRYTMNHKGAYMGWLLTPEVFNTQIERTLPGLGAFYMAGQWVMSGGGGVLSSLYSGRSVIQLLCHFDRKPFLPFS